MISVQVSLYAQNIYDIYKDDSIFIEIPSFPRIYNSKDSLEDGIYLFYNVSRKDSTSVKKKVIYRAEYFNGLKHGVFESFYYSYNKKKKRQELIRYHICDYKDGEKDGIEEICYVSYYAFNSYLVSTNYYGEFKDGKKHGLFIHSYNGIIIYVELYENGELKEVLLKRENSELRELIENN